MGELQRLAQLPVAFDLLNQEVVDLRQQCAELPGIKEQLADLQVVTARRCDTQQEVGRLKEQLRKLTGTVVRKIEVAETEHVNHMKAELHKLQVVVDSRASQDRMALLEERVDEELRHITSCTAGLGQLEARVDILAGSQCSRSEDYEHLAKELQTSQDRNDSRIADLQRRFSGLQGQVSAQDATAVLEQLNAQYRTLSTSLAQKADFSAIEHLKHQVCNSVASAANNVESSISQQLAAQYKTMAAAVGLASKEAVADGAPCRMVVPPLGQPFVACVDSLRSISQDVHDLSTTLGAKADKSRVDQLIEQVQVLADLLTPKLIGRTRPRGPTRPQSARAGCRPAIPGMARSFRSSDGL